MAQSKMGIKPEVNIGKIQEAVVLDGLLDEPFWDRAEVATDFQQYFPFDTSIAIAKTEVKLAFDDEFLYIGAILYDSLQETGEYVSVSLRRDYRGGNVDGFTIDMDPFLDGTNGFFFGVNPYNVQREGMLANGGAVGTDFDLAWDNKWFSATHIGDGYWSLEMAIPFKTLRYDQNAKQWGINFYRIDSKYNERSVWSPIPRQFTLFNLGFTGRLNWLEPPSKPGANISLIPYVAGGGRRNHQEGTPQENEFSVGGDAKISITPSLNLDLTFNPDFSQVEVDEQQTNITPFEIFLPERRQFFLENADLFSSFGFDDSRPFFSRRIGVAIDSATGQNVENQIYGGMRLSGKLDQNWRVGLMNMQTASNPEVNVNGSNYTVAALQRRVFQRSNISGIFVNQQTPDGVPVDVFNPEDGNYSRLAGLDYNLASADGTWTGKVFYHRTFDEGEKSNPFAHGLNINYNSLRFFATYTHQVIGEGFDPKVGFVPRNDFNRVIPSFGVNFYPKSKVFNQLTLETLNNTIWNDAWGLTDNNFNLTFSANFQNQAFGSVSYIRDNTVLNKREGLKFYPKILILG